MEPGLVVGSCVHEVRAAWLCMHGSRIGSEGRAVCGWGQDWLCMVSGLVVHGVRACM